MFHSLTRKDRIGGSFNLQSRGSETTQLLGFRDTSSGRGMSLDLAWTHNLRPASSTICAGAFRGTAPTLRRFSPTARNVAAQLGIAGTSSNPLNYGPPNLSFTNFGGLSDAAAALVRNQTSAIADRPDRCAREAHLDLRRSEYQRHQLNNRSDQNGRGSFVFSGLATSGFDSSGQPLAATGFDFADFLLGLPNSSSIRYGSADTYFRGTNYSCFAQDDWRLRSNLTLNLGLRYEFPHPADGKVQPHGEPGHRPGIHRRGPGHPWNDRARTPASSRGR